VLTQIQKVLTSLTCCGFIQITISRVHVYITPVHIQVVSVISAIIDRLMAKESGLFANSRK